MIIEKKILPKRFQQIKDGEKKYELRLADFDAHDGDMLVLKEWNPTLNIYTGNEITKVISHILKTNDIDY